MGVGNALLDRGNDLVAQVERALPGGLDAQALDGHDAVCGAVVVVGLAQLGHDRLDVVGVVGRDVVGVLLDVRGVVGRDLDAAERARHKLELLVDHQVVLGQDRVVRGQLRVVAHVDGPGALAVDVEVVEDGLGVLGQQGSLGGLVRKLPQLLRANKLALLERDPLAALHRVVNVVQVLLAKVAGGLGSLEGSLLGKAEGLGGNGLGVGHGGARGRLGTEGGKTIGVLVVDARHVRAHVAERLEQRRGGRAERALVKALKQENKILVSFFSFGHTLSLTIMSFWRVPSGKVEYLRVSTGVVTTGSMSLRWSWWRVMCQRSELSLTNSLLSKGHTNLFWGGFFFSSLVQ